jgi:flagellar basal-body rod protein FlgB
MAIITSPVLVTPSKPLVFGVFGLLAHRLLKTGKFIAMIDALFGNATYLAAKKMLDATALRHEAIASNLANLEVPNYKRLDVSSSFETQLHQAVSAKDTAQISALQPELTVDTLANAGRSDGNTVQLENEMLKLDQNMVEHSLETQLVSGALMKMRLAITGHS